jgi:DNA-binding transcriptional LysR family regulator
MEVFVRVVEAKGFSAAARQLGMSKSAASKIVSRLEDRLGARLLNRTTRRLSLTDAGNAYYERATRVMAEAQEAELAVSRLQAQPRGWLRVNAPMTFGTMHLAPALPDFMWAHPELHVELHLDDKLVDLVEEGYDVAIRIRRLADSSLIARRLCAVKRIICASPDYLARMGTPTHPRDLARHNVFTYEYIQGTPDDLQWAGPDGTGRVRIAGSLRTNNGEVMRDAAIAGLGISLFPDFMVAAELRAGKLVEILTDYVDDSMSLFAVYPHSRHLSAKVRAFVDFMAERFRGEPPHPPAGAGPSLSQARGA